MNHKYFPDCGNWGITCIQKTDWSDVIQGISVKEANIQIFRSDYNHFMIKYGIVPEHECL